VRLAYTPVSLSLPLEKYSEMALDFIVIPRSCSSSKLSMYLS